MSDRKNKARDSRGLVISNMPSLLRVEDDQELVELRCPGTDLLLWPLVRTPFLRLILSDLLYDTPIPTAPAATSSDQVLGLLEAGLKNALGPPKQTSVLIRTTAMAENHQEGKRFNRMSDYFRDIDPKGTTVLEDLGGQRVPRNRYNTRVIYHDPILARASISARLSGKRHFEAATELVNLLESRARLILGWEMSAAKRNWYTALVARYISRSPRLVSEYTTLLRSSGARLVIAEEACYGNAMVCLIAAARSLGIPTAEMQHGMVTSGHDAYALAPSLAASLTYKNMLPDYFLSYGKWWNTQLQVPVTPIEIGNPHGDTKRANAEREKAVLLEGRHRICSDIIILGDGIDSKIYIEFAIKLASLLPDRQVIIRPHPQEKKYFKAAHPTDRIGSVKVDTNADIYTSLSTAHAVVSEMSTGLFEAIGLANRVFMWATPKAKFYLPKHPFEEFSDVFHLAQALTAPPPKNKDWTVNDIWAPNWQANYQKFVQEVIK